MHYFHFFYLFQTSSNVENLSPQTLRGVMKELEELAKTPLDDINLHINQQDITDIQATITGPGNLACC